MFFDLPPVAPLTIAQAIPELSTPAADRAQAALICARNSGAIVDRYLVFDASKPANLKRLYVIDVSGESPKLVFSDWVAHGSGSDPDGDGIASKFSNTVDSHMTSLALFKVAERYQGQAMDPRYRLDGLTPGFNTRARERAVVIHQAGGYVTSSGRVGRSQGCPAVRPEVMKALDERGMKNTLLWIDAEGQGLDEALSIQCPAAKEWLADQRLSRAFSPAPYAVTNWWIPDNQRVCSA